MVRSDARDHAAAGPERRRHARHAAAGGAAYGDPVRTAAVRTAAGRAAAAVLAEAGLGPRSLARGLVQSTYEQLAAVAQRHRYGEAAGSPRLREVLASSQRVRAASVSVRDMIVCSGFTQGVALTLRILREHGHGTTETGMGLRKTAATAVVL